jgi:hypothetical protein
MYTFINDPFDGNGNTDFKCVEILFKEKKNYYECKHGKE